MDPSLLSHLILILTLFFISAFFSATETALFSINKLDLEKLKKDKHPKYKAIKELLKEPREVLITILICNDLSTILISILSATIFYKLFHAKPLWMISAISIFITTPLLLIIGEITPKTLAARFHINFAIIACDTITVINKILTPIRLVISKFTYFVVTSLSFQPNEKNSLMEDEFKMLIEASKKEGIIGEDEQDLIYNVFKLGDKVVADIMTKRENIFSLAIDEPLEKLMEAVRINYYSRIPVYEKDTDVIIGVLLTKDLLTITRRQTKDIDFVFELQKIIRLPYYIPINKKADVLFRELKTKKLHMAIVVDEYGKLAGLITMEDLLEEIFGEIYVDLVENNKIKRLLVEKIK